MKNSSFFLARVLCCIPALLLLLSIYPNSNINAQENAPVTVSQYCVFLNDTAKLVDPYHVYEQSMKSSIKQAAIRQGKDNYFSYYCIAGTENNFVPYLNKKTALRFCSWLEKQSPNRDSSFSIQEVDSSNIADNNAIEKSNEPHCLLTDPLEDKIYSVKSSSSRWMVITALPTSYLSMLGTPQTAELPSTTVNIVSEIASEVVESLIAASILKILNSPEEAELFLWRNNRTSASTELHLGSSHSIPSLKITEESMPVHHPVSPMSRYAHSLETEEVSFKEMDEKNTPLEKNRFKYSENLAKQYISNRKNYNETDDAIFTELGKIDLRGKIVLDVGCGGGKDIETISRMGGIPIGFDSSATMLDKELKKSEGHPNSSEFFIADAGDRLPFRDNSIDVVFSNFVFHYIRNSRQFFKELSRILTPGGKIVATFNISEVQEGYEKLYNTSMPIRLGGEVNPVIVQNLIKSHTEIEDAIQKNGFYIEKEEELDHPNAVIDPNAFINSEGFDSRPQERFATIVTKKVMLFVLRNNKVEQK